LTGDFKTVYMFLLLILLIHLLVQSWKV